MDEVRIVEADDELWGRYTVLAERAYGHPVQDIALLGPHADRRVALRGGQVIAGGMGLLVPQYFGGRPVPAVSMACGCVAPEERGRRLAARLAAERLRAVRERGAVVASLWTASTGYAARLGWAAPARVFSYTVPTGALAGAFTGAGFEIAHAPSADGVRDEWAARWNGPWQRPAWWDGWQTSRHPGLATYTLARPGQAARAVVSVTAGRGPGGERQLVVQDMWADDPAAAGAAFAFLGRHHSRIPTVTLARTGLPPAPFLDRLSHAAAVTARTWHPWMLRILDLKRAVLLRGWPEHVELELPVEVVTEPGDGTDRYTLRVSSGTGVLEPTIREGLVTLSRGQFAVWYAGGYRSTAAALLDGIRGHPAAVARLLAATGEREPWLADYF